MTKTFKYHSFLFQMTRCCHHRNQSVDARNRIQVSFCPVLLVSHRNHSSLNRVDLCLNV